MDNPEKRKDAKDFNVVDGTELLKFVIGKFADFGKMLDEALSSRGPRREQLLRKLLANAMDAAEDIDNQMQRLLIRPKKGVKRESGNTKADEN